MTDYSNIKIDDIKLNLPIDKYNEDFIILVINQDDTNNNGLYIRNDTNTITKLILNNNKISKKMFIYDTIYDEFNMNNIIINKLQKSNVFFQLYEKKFDRPNKLNLTDYTKIKTNNNENFDLFMIYYINKYISNNNRCFFSNRIFRFKVS